MILVKFGEVVSISRSSCIVRFRPGRFLTEKEACAPLRLVKILRKGEKLRLEWANYGKGPYFQWPPYSEERVIVFVEEEKKWEWKIRGMWRFRGTYGYSEKEAMPMARSVVSQFMRINAL